MPKRNGLYVVQPDGGRPLSAEEERLDALLVSLDQLRKGGPITEEVQRWAREELLGGMLGELIAEPEKFRWIRKTGYWHLVYCLLLDLSPEVVSAEEVGRIDTGITLLPMELGR